MTDAFFSVMAKAGEAEWINNPPYRIVRTSRSDVATNAQKRLASMALTDRDPDIAPRAATNATSTALPAQFGVRDASDVLSPKPGYT